MMTLGAEIHLPFVSLVHPCSKSELCANTFFDIANTMDDVLNDFVTTTCTRIFTQLCLGQINKVHAGCGLKTRYFEVANSLHICIDC